MKATILAEHPFLIPFGTKVRIIPDCKGVPATECFFAGYRAFDNTIIDKFCFFPLFKKPTRDGRMGNRNIDYQAGFLGYSNLQACSIEILELPDGYDMRNPDPNKYNNLSCMCVELCTLEMMALAKRHGIQKFSFNDFPEVDTPSATFDNGDTDAYLDVDSLEFSEDGIKVNSVAGGGFCGYLDGQYGEYFDTAEALPKIYNAFIKALNTIVHAE